MASRRDSDPMSGLLTSISGIDSAVFRKNEPMSAQKARQPAKSTVSASKQAKAEVVVNAVPSAMSQGSSAYQAARSGLPLKQPPIPRQPPKDAFMTAQSAFNGLDELGVGARGPSQMKSAPVPTPMPPRPASYDSLTQTAIAYNTSPAVGSGASSQVNSVLGEDLDAMFGGPQGSAAPPSDSGLGFDLGMPQTNSVGSAATGYGMPGTNSKASTATASFDPAPQAPALEDLFGAPSIPQGPLKPTQQHNAGSELNIFSDVSPSAAHSVPTAQRPAGTDVHAIERPGSAEAEYNVIFERIRSHSKDDTSAPLATPPSSSFPAFERPIRVASPSSAPAGAAAADSHELPPQGAVQAATPATAPSQVRSSNHAPTPSHSGSYFDQYGEDTLSNGVRDADDGPPPPSYDAVMQRQQVHGSNTGAGAGDYKKQAEKIGKWFAGSAKKLAKVAQQKAKEMQAKLEEMEMGHKISQQNGSSATWSQNLDDMEEYRPPGRKHWGDGPTRASSGRVAADNAVSSAIRDAGGDIAQIDGSGARAPSRGLAADELPEHYYEWAATIAQMQDAAERRQVLDGMPVEERGVLLKLLHQQGVPNPYVPPQRQHVGGVEAAKHLRHVSSAEHTAQQSSNAEPRGPSPGPAGAPSAGPVLGPAAAAKQTAPEGTKASTRKAVQAVAQADLLGMSSRSDDAPAAAAAPAAASAAPNLATADADLLSMSASPTAKTPSAPRPASVASTAAPATSLDEFLAGGAAVSQSVSHAVSEPDFAAMFGTGSSRSKAAANSMIDLGNEADIPEGHQQLYADEQGASDEPELRKQARERRLAEMHSRMRSKLQDKLDAEQAEVNAQSQKVSLREQYKPAIAAWSHQKKDNIRALLSSMHTVVWEGSDWKPPNMSDIVEPQKVRRWYMKANLIVHPDKVKQKGGTLEQVTLADMIFDVLKQAYAKFEVNELR